MNSNPRSAHPFILIVALILRFSFCLFSASTKLSLYRKWSQFDKAVEEQKVNNWDWKCNPSCGYLESFGVRLQVVGPLRCQDPSEHPSASRIAAGTPIFPRHEHASRAARIRVAARHCERIDMLERIRIHRRVGKPAHGRVRRRRIVKDEGQNLTSRRRVAENDGSALGRTVIEKARDASGRAVDIEAARAGVAGASCLRPACQIPGRCRDAGLAARIDRAARSGSPSRFTLAGTGSSLRHVDV